MKKQIQDYKAKALERYHSDYVSLRRVEKTVATSPEAKEIEKKAIALEKAGRYRRASNLWLKCMDVAQTEVERAKIAVRRQQCITRGNRRYTPEYSGICPGVVIYD